MLILLHLNRNTLLFIIPDPGAGAYPSLLQLLTPSLLRQCQCLHPTDEDTEVKDSAPCRTAMMCELELWGQWEEGGPVKLSSSWFWSSALPPSHLQFTVTGDMNKWGLQCWQRDGGVHVIITRVGTSVCCPAVTLLLPDLHSFSLIKVLPPDCLGDFWQTYVVITSSPHFSHPQEGARLLQSEQQKMSSKNAKIAWREGAALGYEGHVIWGACGCQYLPPTRHLMSRPAGKRLPYDPIIKQVHPGGSSLVNIKEENEDSGHYLAQGFSLLSCPPAPRPVFFLCPPGGNLFAVKLFRAAEERICFCTGPFQRSSVNNKYTQEFLEPSLLWWGHLSLR